MNVYPREEAIPFITYNSQRKFELNEEAARIVSRVTQPIGVVCVAGQYRTGKSYFINRVLLNRQSGFEVGSTVNACTKGLWIWSSPLRTLDAQTYFVVDTEGIAGLDADQTHDLRILTMATLVSSLLIYNSVGAIDEQTIEQLGILSATAKNIQSREESDMEDLARYYPSLLWILRDFSLQLTDSDGDPITAKEYMERAFQQQRGFSDGVESKNRIRRLMAAFFKQRDCATLVRPVADEYQLQQLTNTDLTQLRPEFLEQVLSIRRRVISMITPKRIKGTNLNGPTFIAMVREYITQMNQNHRVQIEWAWDRIMREEVGRASTEAYELFEKCLRDTVLQRLPLLKDELKGLYQSAKEQAHELLQRRCHGDVPPVQLKELNKRFKTRIQAISQLNEKEAHNVCQAFVNREFVSIQKRLVEYRSILEFERDVKLFYQFLLEHGPKTVLKYQVYQEFYHKMMNEGAQMFIKTLNQDLSHAKVSQDEQLQACEERLRELKLEKERETRELLERVRQCERERADEQVRMKRMQEQLREGRDTQDSQVKELRRALEQERKFSQQSTDEHRQRASELEHLLKQAERQLFLKESEFNKQKALLEQRLQHLQRQLDEFQRKEQSLDTTMVSTKSEYSQQLKDVTTKYEVLVQSLQDKIHQKLDHCNMMQEQLVQNEQKFEVLRNRAEQREQTLQAQLNEQLATTQKLKLELQDRVLQDKTYQDEFRDRYESEIQALSELCARLEAQLREKQDKYVQLRQSIEKDRAMLQQRTQFLEVENEDLRQQLGNLKRSHEQTIHILETSKHEFTKQGFNKQILEIKEAHINEVKQLEVEYEMQRRKLYQQIDSLATELNEAELRATLQQNEFTKELQMLRAKVQSLEEQKARYQTQHQANEQQRARLVKESEERFVNKTRQFEKELDETRKKYSSDMRDLQSKHEEQMLQLRNVYELEKDRLERRVVEERDGSEKRFVVTMEECEQRHQEEQQQWEEDMHQLKEDLNNQEVALASMSQHYQNEIELRERQIKELESANSELKQGVAKQQGSMQQQFELQVQMLKGERNDLGSHCEQLERELKLKESELTATITKRNQLEEMYHSRDVTFETQRSEWQNERNQLIRKIDELKKRNDEMQDGFLQRKMVLEKNVALSQQQQNFFLNARVEELQTQFDQLNAKHETTLRQQMKEQSDDFSERLKRLLDERQDLQQRYDRLRMQVKDTESTATRVASELEKENNMLHDQLMVAEKRLNDLDTQYQLELSQLAQQLASYRDSTQFDKHPLYAEIERLKSLMIEVEGERIEIQTSYERDAVLWQGKFKFLEEQRDQAKQDLADSMLKFEQTLAYLQKARMQDRQEEESSLSEMIIAVEKKYQLQLLDLAQTHEQRVLESEERSRFLERELKSHQDRTVMDAHGRMGKSFINERKVAELLEAESQLKDELELAKSQSDMQSQDFLRRLEEAQAQTRAKLNEAEERYKELERRRSTMIFEHEKEKAKWALERDHLQQKINELQEQFNQSERRRETTTRENEKLRNENKHKKRLSNLMSATHTRRSPGKSPIDTNRSNLSITAYATSFANKLSGLDVTHNNSFEVARSQLYINDGDDSFIQPQRVSEGTHLPAESFEAYYAMMKEK